jgi:hypothetical protein
MLQRAGKDGQSGSYYFETALVFLCGGLLRYFEASLAEALHDALLDLCFKDEVEK